MCYATILVSYLVTPEPNMLWVRTGCHPPVARHERIPANSGGRTRTHHRVTRLLRGPGTRTTYAIVYGRQAGVTRMTGITSIAFR